MINRELREKKWKFVLTEIEKEKNSAACAKMVKLRQWGRNMGRRGETEKVDFLTILSREIGVQIVLVVSMVH